MFAHLDDRSLASAELVCRKWQETITNADGLFWRKLLEEKIRSDPVWKSLGTRQGWIKNVFNSLINSVSSQQDHRSLYASAMHHLRTLKENWRSG